MIYSCFISACRKASTFSLGFQPEDSMIVISTIKFDFKQQKKQQGFHQAPQKKEIDKKHNTISMIKKLFFIFVIDY